MKALDFLFPRNCNICHKRLLPEEKVVCSECMEDIPFTYFWTVEDNEMADKINARIQEYLVTLPAAEGYPGHRKEQYCNACALMFYRDESNYRQVPMQIKYFANFFVARHFGNLLGEKLGQCPWFTSVDMVIPVPLHWSRAVHRGYNQAYLIARAISKTCSAGTRLIRTDVLYRTRRTKTQTRLTPEEKKVNVAYAFAVRRRAIASIAQKPHHILLVDDVFTTGATLAECYKALKPFVHPDTEFSFASIAYYE